MFSNTNSQNLNETSKIYKYKRIYLRIKYNALVGGHAKTHAQNSYWWNYTAYSLSYYTKLIFSNSSSLLLYWCINLFISHRIFFPMSYSKRELIASTWCLRISLYLFFRSLRSFLFQTPLAQPLMLFSQTLPEAALWTSSLCNRRCCRAGIILLYCIFNWVNRLVVCGQTDAPIPTALKARLMTVIT